MAYQYDIFEQSRKRGYTCTCCGQFVKEYSRPLNSSMAAVLILICQSNKRDFFHVEKWLKQIGKPELRADFHKLCFWNFLEKKTERREDTSTRNGHYKITGRGIAFVHGEFQTKERVVIFNNKFQSFEGKDITIRDALRKKFRYDELMNFLNPFVEA